jgi:hypothetical protein
MFVNHTTPVRLAHFHCKIGVLASYGTYYFPEVYPELTTEYLGHYLEYRIERHAQGDRKGNDLSL